MQTTTHNKNDSNSALQFLYKTAAGRMILKLISCRAVSKAAGLFLDSSLSKFMIKRFIKNNGIDMSQFEDRDFKSFNDFFTRKLAQSSRFVDSDPSALISPCDSRLSVYGITEKAIFNIKGVPYSVESLLKDSDLASEFSQGLCLIFRLCTDDYHRYCYFDNGSKGENIFIKGRLHTVQPIAFERYDVYAENCREYTVMNTENFGKAVQIEVGALIVGKISNFHEKSDFKRGDEKGMFEFGGSTIVLLLKKDSAVISQEILENSAQGIETIVKYGEAIGRKA